LSFEKKQFYWYLYYGDKMNDKNSRKHGYKIGLRDGFEQGIIQGKKMCADEMLKLGLDLKIIKKVTKLSVAEIKANYNKN